MEKACAIKTLQVLIRSANHRSAGRSQSRQVSQSQISWAESEQALVSSVWCEWSRGLDDRRRRCKHTHTHSMSVTLINKLCVWVSEWVSDCEYVSECVIVCVCVCVCESVCVSVWERERESVWVWVCRTFRVRAGSRRSGSFPSALWTLFPLLHPVSSSAAPAVAPEGHIIPETLRR